MQGFPSICSHRPLCDPCFDSHVRSAICILCRPPVSWNNIVDQYGWSFVLSESGVRVGTSEFANDTTIGTIKRWHCMQQGGTCLKVGFLPYDRFPRHSSNWQGLSKTAMVYHLTHACAQEQSPCFVPHVRPFRGNRQRLSRYDENDFDEMVATLKGIGAWKVDNQPPFGVAVKDEAALRAA